MEDEDFAFALSLQEKFSSTVDNNNLNNHKKDSQTSVVDDCWETIDPTPDIRQLFLEFNDTYFDGKLSGCEVRWSPRMTLCAGLCCYEGRGGLCSIRLSLPLLKLRPRKDLVQTLLHEMIHALLFVTNNNKDHDAHGPEFHKHMYRINKQSGANITVYHNFHDEVNEYRQHWWRCNGPCQKRPPYYGMVKRSMNRAPSPRDIWWADHQQKCGGTYTKVKEPEDYGKKKKKSKEESMKHDNKNVSSFSGMRKIDELWKKEPDTTDSLIKNKENNIPKLNNVESTPAIIPFAGKGFVLGGHKAESSTVTRPWLLKNHFSESTATSNDRDKRQDLTIISSPSNEHPEKIGNKRRRKVHSGGTIIDAFKKIEKAEKKTSIVIIDDDSPTNLVECPLCQIKIREDMINPHLDNCLS